MEFRKLKKQFKCICYSLMKEMKEGDFLICLFFRRLGINIHMPNLKGLSDFYFKCNFPTVLMQNVPKSSLSNSPPAHMRGEKRRDMTKLLEKSEIRTETLIVWTSDWFRIQATFLTRCSRCKGVEHAIECAKGKDGEPMQELSLRPSLCSTTVSHLYFGCSSQQEFWKQQECIHPPW